ncbi:hypothetical protein RJ639_019711 [Escallonia herrerae]|uniref:Inhibitor I9 domain-containing protein n=1 Tax=Escallonia herrerae TaxID=1293975 RepID=A0AA88V897_9ASTE|nr:hypothetical protein RJ639_019711 [Escallonia herrerae]
MGFERLARDGEGMVGAIVSPETFCRSMSLKVHDVEFILEEKAHKKIRTKPLLPQDEFAILIMSVVYIVYLGLNHFHDPLLTSKHHLQLLANVFESNEAAKQAMLYSYKHSFSGFSAKLDPAQAATLARTFLTSYKHFHLNDEITNMGETIAEMKEVISVFESKTMQLHTTRSWDFMGLTLDFSSEVTPLQLAYGDDIVVGIFDTGLDTFFFYL